MTVAMSVLIVDDDEMVLRTITRMLRREPITFELCSDPLVAEATCRARAFDVVVSDYMMPKLSGLDLLRLVRAASPSTVRLLATAYAEGGEVALALEDGTVEILVEKPLRMTALAAAMNAVASRRPLHITTAAAG